MKRSAPLKRKTPLRPRRHEPAVEREEKPRAFVLPTVKPLHRGVISRVIGAQPVPKNPSTRLPDLRKLAEGEECCGCGGLYCHPSTTVWAHANELAANKGAGYKAHDHLGAFLGKSCHDRVDAMRKDGDAAQQFLRQASERTHERLREIAGNPMLKPWRVNAARWALAQLEGK